jgi:hypothetical protein
MAGALYRRHDPASQTKYQEVKQLARSQQRVLSASPGTLKQRTQAGKQYWLREHIRVDDKKADEYIGSVAATAKQVVDRFTQEVDLAKAPDQRRVQATPTRRRPQRSRGSPRVNRVRPH